jgi:predicted transcriptional regulator
MADKLTDSERIEEGQVLVRTIIEMLGAPKDHIVATMKNYVEAQKSSDKFEIIKEYFSEPEETEKDGQKLFTTYTELEIWFKDITKLVEFCFDALPSSIEILEPSKVAFQSMELSGLLNDLQAKLHKLDMALKNNNASQQVAAHTFNTLITNFIGFCLEQGEDTPEKVSLKVGLAPEKVQKILDELTEKGLVSKDGESYSRISKK